MTENKFNLTLLIIAGMLTAQAVYATGTQQKGMVDNLEDSIPYADLQEQQDLQNPRIVIPENLQEMPDVKAVSNDDRDSSFTQKTKEELKKLEEELQLQTVDKSKKLLDKTDRLMEASRLPLSYIQEHVPFLTKRDIIFFGRLEFDGAMYSSGVLDDDDGFRMRRFRVGLAGHVIPWPGWNYKLEFDLTDGENTLSDAYLS